MPEPITIYGASDDLVEVEGAIREEYTLGDPCTRLRLTAPDGDSLDIVLCAPPAPPAAPRRGGARQCGLRR